MSTKKQFKPEEIRHLRANPYTRCVTADTISYTLAFKEAFWALSLQGYTGPAAFRKLGYNTEVLGFERVHNTTKRIRREAKSLEGLREGTRGGVMRSQTFQRAALTAAAKRVGVPGFHPHELRHTAASLAIASGADVKVVQRMLGHASAAMTLDTYAELFEDDLDSVAVALDSQRSASLGP